MTARKQPPRAPSARALVHAAKDLLGRACPSEIGGRMVSKRAGVNYGLVHRHFGSKDRLFAISYEELERDFEDVGFDRAGRMPGPLDDHPQFWRAVVYRALDPKASVSEEMHTHIVERTAASVRRYRPDLDEHHAATLASLALAIRYSVPIHRFTHAASVGLESDDPIIDHWIERWLDGLFENRGPFGGPVPGPRTIVTRSPDNRVTVLPGGPGRSEVERAIIVAAAGMLADHPPSDISGRDIAAAAGVSYGLVHYHFGSKDAVIAHAAEMLRIDFFVNEGVGGGCPDFFAIRRHRAYLLSTTRLGVEGVNWRDGGRFPVSDTILETLNLDGKGTNVQTRARVAVALSQMTQGAWTLLLPWLSSGLRRDIRDLEPLAAAYLARMVSMAADPSVPID